MAILSRQVLWSAFVLSAAACSGPSGGVTGPSAVSSIPSGESAAQPSARCTNVSFEGTAQLGVFDGALGAVPTPLMVGSISGAMGSIVESVEAKGSRGQGAQHLTLHHEFVSAQGSFQTSARAVCAPAGRDPNVCRVNDVMRIVSGTGVFANATGQLRNHGIIDLNTFTLTVSLRGRVCGDGL